MRIRTIHRIVAVLLIELLVFDVIWPSLAHALTGGPSQPEFESFEPVSTDQMVDLFTGDMNYNIPLLTVPGPNGGYPINLAYHGGPGMEQEASWVGLGWNINVGAITRQLRGLPDDFNGDIVTKEVNIKPQTVLGMKWSPVNQLENEVTGVELPAPPPNMTYELYHHSYRGVGFRVGMNLVKGKKSVDESGADKYSPSAGISYALNFDSQSGLGFSPSLSLQRKAANGTSTSLSLGTSMHSSGGMLGLRASASRAFRVSKKPTQKQIKENGGKEPQASTQTVGSGIDFGAASYVPGQFANMVSTHVNIGLEYGKVTAPLKWTHKGTIGATFSRTEVLEEVYDLPAYGYQRYDGGQGNAFALLDMNRDKEGPVTRRTPNAPMPLATYDPYSIMGQGTGGVFRAYRNDIGLLHDERKVATSTGVNAPVELGFNTPIPPETQSVHIGFDPGIIDTRAYSGGWRSGLAPLEDQNGPDMRFRGKTTSEPLYEPMYFRTAGERTASSSTDWPLLNNTGPVRFKLGMHVSGDLLGSEPRVQPFLGDEGYQSSIPQGAMSRSSREKRVQNIEHRTMREINARPEFACRPFHLFAMNQLPNGVGTRITYNDEGTRADHIGEVSVLEPSGLRYVYGLPAYNHVQREVAFAVNGPQDPADLNDMIIPVASYDTDDDGDLDELRNNNMGRDNFYSATTLPPYVHSHLLTEVRAADYVDLTGDGPTKDDLGYWVKFNYAAIGVQSPHYQWRIPFIGANFQRGDLSNTKDDKATYMYGRKDLYFVHSVETKTHVALFRMATDRADGCGAKDETNDQEPGSNAGMRQPRLTAIELYSREDLVHPIKTVHFGYATYDHVEPDLVDELCKGAPNCDANRGKLTLRTVWFEHQANDKGRLAPYVFHYGLNPAFDERAMDRWGNYKPVPANGYVNHVYPYVMQAENDPTRDANAGAWTLERIQLPSGGSIRFTYAADDYSTVEDKPAMQMFRIVGTSAAGPGNHSPDDDEPGDIGAGSRRIYFELERPINEVGDVDLDGNANTDDDKRAYIAAHLSGIEDLYYKTMQRLCPTGSADAWEYVEGYCRIEAGPQESGWNPFDPTMGFFTVQPVTYMGGINVHPFRKAGWQYLRYERPDLINPDWLPDNLFVQAAASSAILMLSSLNLLLGYYNMANIKGYCKRISLPGDGHEPSFVRLNSPDGVKYGGGYRVTRVEVTDGWDEDQDAQNGGQNSRTYGKTYAYTTERNRKLISSGVAAYEPQIGSEEIPHHLPVWYNESNAMISMRHADAFLEKPFGEALFPAPQVGYAKVTVRDLVPPDTDAERNLNGVVVNEFYTAKDFPVIVDHTLLDRKELPVQLFIPFVGSIDINHNGYSQGYSVELNDMHGKPKATSTYANCKDPEGVPKARTRYIYQQSAGRLTNTANVLYDHFEQETAELGVTKEMWVDAAEHASTSQTIEESANLAITGALPPALPIPLFTLFPGWDYSSSLYRTIVTTKVINRLGLLSEVINEVDGAESRTENLVYDAYTGAPLLTRTNNQFGDPVYDYTYAAHFAYDGMGPAYKNWGAVVVAAEGISNGQATIPDADRYFVPGDEVEVSQGASVTVLWVMQVTTNGITLASAANSAVSFGPCEIRVRRSGRRNMQSVHNGKIVSLQNPIEQFGIAPSAFLQWWNANMPGETTPLLANWTSLRPDYDQCGVSYAGICLNSFIQPDPSAFTRLNFCANTSTSACVSNTCDCSSTIDLVPPIESVNGEELILGDITIVGTNGDPDQNGDPYVVVAYSHADGSTTEHGGYWHNLMACFGSACGPVIHADATEYKDAWSYDYEDAGRPSVKNGELPCNTGAVPLANVGAFNPYRFGQAGIWRPSATHLFQVDRLNEPDELATNIRTQGEYALFAPFNFADPNQDVDGRWVKREEMTRYDAYGWAVESKDALDIFSSKLFAHGNSLESATAVNAAYHQVGFDGFEDHGGGYDMDRNHGHLAVREGFDPDAQPQLSTTRHHTGLKSLRAEAGTSLVVSSALYGSDAAGSWHVANGDHLMVSAWVHTGDQGLLPTAKVYNGNTEVTQNVTVRCDTPPLEGWRKVDVEIIAPVNGPLRVAFLVPGATQPWYLDDLRVHPYEAALTTHVYHPRQYWLLAQLDDRNFATFYDYDEEGRLVQVRQETERGVMTLRTSRKQTVQTTP